MTQENNLRCATDRKAKLCSDYNLNRYKIIVKDFPDVASLAGLTPAEIEMVLWAYHHYATLCIKKAHPNLNLVQKLRGMSLKIADYQHLIAKGPGDDIGYYKIKPFSLFYMGQRTEAEALVEEGLEKYQGDLGIINTKVALLGYQGFHKEKFLASSEGYALAVQGRNLRLAGNFARQVADSLAALKSFVAARAWLTVAIGDWKKSQRKTKRTPSPLSAKNHIVGAKKRIRELDVEIANQMQR
jgi:hypothetical protein